MLVYIYYLFNNECISFSRCPYPGGMQWSEENCRIQASVLQAISGSTLLLSIATSLVISLVQPPGFLLDDGILILIQTVLLSFERWVSICP